MPALGLVERRGYGVQENGFRTPTYPVMLALLLAPLDRTHLAACRDAHRPTCIDNAAKTTDGGNDLDAIVAAQIFIGTLSTALLFAIGWRLTKNALVAALFGAGYALNLATAFWEISILTETFTTFLLLLSVLLTLKANPNSPESYWALGFVLALLALCHQLFLAYSIVPVAYLYIRGLRSGARASSIRIGPSLLLPLAFVGLWSTYNYAVNGVFTPSTLSGYVLIQMVAPVVQNAPVGYDGIVQPYVGFRDAMIAETGSHSGAIFRAWPAMMGWTGASWSEISSKLTTLSLYLMTHYPQTYLQTAQESWARFWDFQIYHYDPIPASIPGWAVWLTGARVQAALDVLFWVSLPAIGIMFILKRAGRRLSSTIPFGSILFIAATVLYCALLSSLTNYQDNARLRTYVMPLQYGMVIIAMWAGWASVRQLVTKKG